MQDYENIKSLTIYIQIELCDETLEDYLERRNNDIYHTKKNNPDILKTKLDTYQKEAFNIIK